METPSSNSPSFDTSTFPPFSTLAAAALLALLAAAHVLGLSAMTYSLDEVKYLTMWVGGSLCLVVYALLVMMGRATLPPKSVTIAYIGFIGIMVLSNIVSAPEYARWIGWQSIGTHLSLAGYFFLGFACLNTVRMARYGMRLWILLAIATCSFGIFHYLGRFEDMSASIQRQLARSGEAPTGWQSLVATFAASRMMLSTILNTQFFGNFLGLILPISMAGAVVNYELIKDRVRAGEPMGSAGFWLLASIIATLLQLICILLTFSKICVLLAVIGPPVFLLAVNFLTKYDILRIPAWPVALVLAAVLIVSVLYFTRSDRETKFSPLETSVSSRAMIWSGAWNMAKSHPVLGTGPGSFRLEFPKYRSPDYHMAAISNLTISAHNWVLDVLSETGFLGLFATFAYMGAIAFLGWKAVRQCESQIMRVIVLGFMTGVFLYLVGNCATPMIRWPIGAVTLHLALGMTMGVIGTAMKGNVSTTVPPFSWSSKTIAGAAGVLFACVVLVHMTETARNYFQAAIKHNKGLAESTIQSDYLNSSNPRVLDYLETQFTLSAQDFEEAVSINPTFISSYYKLAHSYNRLGGVERLRFFSKLSQVERNPRLIEENREELLAQIENSFAYQEKAFQAYARLQVYAPDYSEVHYNRAVIHMTLAKDRVEVAQKLDLKGDELSKTAEAAHEQFALAVESAEKACKLSNKITIHYMTGNIYRRYAYMFMPGSKEYFQHLHNAAVAYERASLFPISQVIQETGQEEVERDQKNVSAERAADLYFESKDWESAARAYSHLIDKDPGRLEWYEQTITAYNNAGKETAARKVLDQGLEKNPIRPGLLILNAQMAAEHVESNEALQNAWTATLTILELQKRLPKFLNIDQQQALNDIVTKLNSATKQYSFKTEPSGPGAVQETSGT